MIDRFKKIKTKGSANLVRNMIHNAEKMMSDAEYKKALRLWKILAYRSGASVPNGVYVRLAKCCRKLHRYNEAIDALEALDKRDNSYITFDLVYEKTHGAYNTSDWKKLYNYSLEALNYTKEHLPKRIGSISEFNYFHQLCKTYLDIEDYKKTISKYKSNQSKRRIAVFTAIIDSYDTLKPPISIDNRIDYFVFSNEPITSYGIYNVIEAPFFHEDPTRAARFVKTHPHYLLAEYDIAIWIDSNIMIYGDINNLIDNFISSNKAIGAVHHPIRDTTSDELLACIARDKDDSTAMIQQVLYYFRTGFKDKDLIESNVLFYNNRHKKLSKLMNTWWAEIDRYSRRDQLSLMFSINTIKTPWHKLAPKGVSARNHPAFIFSPHDRSHNPILEDLAQEFNNSDNTKPKLKKYSSEKNIDSVTVVVCVHNALEDVTKCLDSVKRHRYVGSKLVIVDDGSEAQTQNFLSNYANDNKTWVKLVRHATAKGYTKAANAGIKKSGGDAVVLLNSDTVVTKNWLKKMSSILTSNRDIGIVGPLSSAASHQSIPDHISKDTQTAVNNLPPKTSIEQMNEYCEKWSKDSFSTLVPLVHGFCFMIRREVIDEVGYFDEKSFPRGYGEESDYCFRATNAGYLMAIATNTYIYHTKSKSYQPETRIKLMRDGSRVLAGKHGSDRIKRAIVSMQLNPLLILMRARASKLYK